MNAVLSFPATSPAITIAELIASRITAKRAEDAAIEVRRAIDAQLADLLRDPAKPEGAISHKEDGYRVSVTFGITRKADSEKLSANWSTMSPAHQAAFKWKAEVSVSELKKLSEADRLALADFIEAKPASPQVKIDVI